MDSGKILTSLFGIFCLNNCLDINIIIYNVIIKLTYIINRITPLNLLNHIIKFTIKINYYSIYYIMLYYIT